MRIITLLLLLSLAFYTQGQEIPTDNPYRSRYGHTLPPMGFHWTDSIRWNQVVNIRDFAAFVKRIKDPGSLNDEDSLNDWLPAYLQAREALVNQGGGVLYFPPLPPRYDGPGGVEPGKDSAYFFSDHLLLKSNTILRGASPASSDARTQAFFPPTFFQFPRYPYSGTYDVPNSMAFKEISIDTSGITGPGKPGFRNVGAVYLDIDGGRFSAHPSFRDTVIGGGTFGVANEKPRNLLLLGLRINNSAIPDPRVPADILPASKIWHRWPWLFGSNIDVYVSANAIIAGCRLNDYQNNVRNALRPVQNRSFDQSGYIPNPYNLQSPPCFPTPSEARFNYNNHYGIFLNRLKKTGYNNAKAIRSNASPQMEPELYAPGNVVVDNWVYKERYVGIQAAGLGLLVKGNVVRDFPQKEAGVGPTGTRCLSADYPPNNTPTFENRGIDFCGWDVVVDSNDCEVFRTKLLPSNDYTSDGEGWYFQGPSGSTAQNITISRNVTRGNNNGLCEAINNTIINKAFNGFANTVTVQNIRIWGNDFGGFPFKIRIDGTNFQDYTLSGLKMFNNTNIHSIEIFAKGCGDSSFVFQNSKSTGQPGCGFADLRVDCFTSLSPDFNQRNENTNTGFLTWPTAAGDDRPGCGTICPTGNGPVCGFPVANITEPAASGFFPAQTLLPVTVSYQLDPQCTPDSMVLYTQAGRRIEAIPASQMGPGSGEVTFASYITPDSCQSDRIYAICFKNGYFGRSASREIRVCIVSSLEVGGPDFAVWPNPGRDRFRIRFTQNPGPLQITWRDCQGRQLDQTTQAGNETEMELNPKLPAGVYHLQLESPRGWRKNLRILVH